MTSTTTATDKARLKRYVRKIKPLLPLATKAYGSRDTVSPQHDASRKYTNLLVEFYEDGGSLLDLCAALGVTYAGVRRRITTVNLTPSSHRPRLKFSETDIKLSAERVLRAKNMNTESYHDQLLNEFTRGIPFSTLAKELGLSSANPLYYGVGRARLRAGEATP